MGKCSDCTTLKQARRVICKKEREILRQAKAYIKQQNMDLKIAKVTIKSLRTRKAKRQSIANAGGATPKKRLKSTVTALRAKAKKKFDRKLAALQKKLKAPKKSVAAKPKGRAPGRSRKKKVPKRDAAPRETEEVKTKAKAKAKAKPKSKSRRVALNVIQPSAVQNPAFSGGRNLTASQRREYSAYDDLARRVMDPNYGKNMGYKDIII